METGRGLLARRFTDRLPVVRGSADDGECSLPRGDAVAPRDRFPSAHKSGSNPERSLRSRMRRKKRAALRAPTISRRHSRRIQQNLKMKMNREKIKTTREPRFLARRAANVSGPIFCLPPFPQSLRQLADILANCLLESCRGTAASNCGAPSLKAKLQICSDSFSASQCGPPIRARHDSLVSSCTLRQNWTGIGKNVPEAGEKVVKIEISGGDVP
jgi:hypothetical protein